MEELVDRRTQLKNGDLNINDTDERRGQKHDILFKNIPVENYITGVLHCLDLHVNYPLEQLQLWIDWRIEDVPDNLIKARKKVVRWKREIIELSNDIADNEAKLKGEIKMFDFAQEQGLPISDGVEAELENDKKILARWKTTLKNKHVKMAKCEAEVNKLQKKHMKKRENRAVWMEIENVLHEEYNALKSNYHGGKMEGPQCRKIAKHAGEIMDKIEETLQDRKWAPFRAARRNEITFMCNATKVLLLIMDKMISLAYRPYMSLDDEEVKYFEDLNDLYQKTWRSMYKNVPPKTHYMYHLIVFLWKFRGMKVHNESAVEEEHQIGARMHQRFKIHGKERKVMSTCQGRANSKSSGVKKQTKKVKKASSRGLTQKNRKEPLVRWTFRELRDEVKLICQFEYEEWKGSSLDPMTLDELELDEEWLEEIRQMDEEELENLDQ